MGGRDDGAEGGMGGRDDGAVGGGITSTTLPDHQHMELSGGLQYLVHPLPYLGSQLSCSWCRTWAGMRTCHSFSVCCPMTTTGTCMCPEASYSGSC
jgi:hypothetical protein